MDQELTLTFDTFTVGRFVSFTLEGCPDGHMSIREGGRPATGGQWCGSAWGYTVYYSEAPSLNLTLQLDRLSEQGIGYNFDFKLSYKLLKASDAHLRLGNSSWRGDLIAGSYCDRVLDRCDQRPCRIQSPNYPGVYPRNVTCYYRIEHRQVPRGKHALLAVRQRNSHKIHIKDQIVKYDRSQRVLRVWDQCNVVQDYLTVYDGVSTTDAVLVRLCGGDVVPDIVSSGSNMLLEFHTSPYDNPFHPVPLSYLPGFELEVQVIYVDARSQTYVRDPAACEFLVTSFDSAWGTVENPRHSLPPNTTCRYHFQGRRHETVWLSFIKYHAAPADPAAYQLSAECNARLSIWDGRLSASSQKNVSLLGEFCKDEVPRLCDHTLLSNSSRFTRPCSLAESYVSSGTDLTLEQFLRQGSVLFPLHFMLRYEFVDTSLEGVHVKDSENPCDRVFTSSVVSPSAGRFQSPRSVFYYGRGGAHNLSCVLRFEPAPNERVRLTFTRARFGERPCETVEDMRTGRWRCAAGPSMNTTAEIWVSEYPWPSIPLPRDCLCSRITEPLVVTALTGSAVEVNFTVTFMNITQDFNDFNFEGEYEFVTGAGDLDNGEECKKLKERRRVRGSSGEVVLKSPLRNRVDENDVLEGVGAEADYDTGCENHPWLIEPMDSSHNFLYLKVRGYELSTPDSYHCNTLNRVLVYRGSGTRNPMVLCPLADGAPFPRSVEVFSSGWNGSAGLSLLTAHARSFVVEFLDREPGRYEVSWMEVSKRPFSSSTSSYTMSTVLQLDCVYKCPELNACISALLWCDGTEHCPSGYDESDSNCAFKLGLPVLYLTISGAALLFLTLLIVFTACLKCRQHRRNKRKKAAALRPNNGSHLHHHHNHNNHHHTHTHTLTHAHNGDTMTKRYPTSAEDLFLDGKDSLC
ncbi:uncharacterized protein LOC111051716 isoform X2 [Nilaparvata lugens]|uniref:uncharacterized protein LOC111051716 isoform X2 n=1 Tax=Nilaparvata lugens TaxID=108931 RepID=UPI00193E714D|nr:uncharacterized protein LOC111051716 isoform X2 [Nilaparvata lugens]